MTSPSSINAIFSLFGKFQKGFNALKKSGLLLKETDLNVLIENYFAFEQYSKEVKLVGTLSKYTCTPNFLAYDPLISTKTGETKSPFLWDSEAGRF